MRSGVLAFVFLQMIGAASITEARAEWRPIKLGAGGFITGYDVSNDGVTRVIRTDTYGDYKWDAKASRWQQMLTASSMGPSIAVPGAGTYVYEVVVAPSRSSRLYRWWRGKVYRSDDTGESWKPTAYAEAVDAFEHGGLAFTSRVFGKRMAIDPVNPDVVLSGSYLNGIRMSTDGGATWRDLSNSIPKSSQFGFKVSNSGGYSAGATKISVASGTAGIPANAKVYFDNGTANAYTVTAGITTGLGVITISPALQAPVPDDTALLSPGGYFIAFDPSSPVVGGRTQGIYVGTYGKGVYHSTDGGLSWSFVGGPTTFKHLVVAKDGAVYTLDHSSRTVVQRYSKGVLVGTAGTWTVITGGSRSSYDGIAVDPHNPARVVLSAGGFLVTSTTRGATWSETAGAYWGPNCLKGPTVPFNGQKRAASDVPWLAWTQECVMSTADIRFDPVPLVTRSGTGSRLWSAEGIGVWYYDFSSSTDAPSSQITWQSQSAGIEQLVSNWIVSPPGGTPTFYGWDRPTFFLNNPDQYPSTHGPNPLVTINMGWHADYASSSPTTLAGIFNWVGKVEYSGLSTDSGKTWTKFATVPANVEAGGIGGSIAASTPSNLLWCPNNNRAPSYTLDGGQSWTTLSNAQIPGLPPDLSENGFGFAYYTNRQACAADRVKPNQFYMFNYLTSIVGIYRSRDGGRSWTRIYDKRFTPGASSAQAKLRTLPGRTGHMFFAYGTQGSHPLLNAGGFFLSTDGDTDSGLQTWKAIANVGGVLAFGYGAAAPGNDYPTVFLAGWVKGVYGVWRGVGTAAQWAAGGSAVTWENLTADTNGYPLGSFDTVKAVEGDANVFGKVYVGFHGSGGVYYQITSKSPVATQPAPTTPTRTTYRP